MASLTTDSPRPLGETYAKNGFHYEQVIRDGNVAIFKQRMRPGEGELAFETIVIRVAPAATMFGKEVPAREIGPSNEDFGVWGWSFDSLVRAKAKMAELLA